MTAVRVVLFAAAVAAGALALMLLAAGFMVAFVTVSGWVGLHHQLGIDTQSSPYYDFGSGSGPMVIAALGFSGAAGALLRSLNCHRHGCPWIGRYPVAGGRFRTCRRHSPDPNVREGLREHHLQAAHKWHLRRR